MAKRSKKLPLKATPTSPSKKTVTLVLNEQEAWHVSTAIDDAIRFKAGDSMYDSVIILATIGKQLEDVLVVPDPY
jgi:hypothetical protein